MVVVAQLVRASVCGTEGRGFETHLPPKIARETGHFYAQMSVRITYFIRKARDFSQTILNSLGSAFSDQGCLEPNT